MGTIRASTEPGADVILDGVQAGTVDDTGILLLQDVPVGKHELLSKKNGYEGAQVKFNLDINEYKQETLPLRWLGGYFTISTQPSDATVSITGPSPYVNKNINNTLYNKCEPGTYTVTVAAVGYLSLTRSFQVKAGEKHVEQIQLQVDPAFVANQIADARSKLYTDSPGAVQDVQRVLRRDPANAEAEAVLAEAEFQLGDMRGFVDAGTQALQGGRSITVMLMHLHFNIFHSWIHQVEFTISKTGLAFRSIPTDTKCKMPTFIPYSQITLHGTGQFMTTGPPMLLSISYHPNPPKNVGASSGGSLHNLNFVVVGSIASKNNNPGTNNSGFIVDGISPFMSPSSAVGIMQSVNNLITVAERPTTDSSIQDTRTNAVNYVQSKGGEYSHQSDIEGTTHGCIGINVQQQSFTSYFNGYFNGNGVPIVSVQSGSSAEEAGLRAGDVIRSVDGREINNYDDLVNAISHHKPGTVTFIHYNRNGQNQMVTVTIRSCVQ
ncbi:MAG: PDZ domain-containing protein [Acidobacteriaceae bacterium]